MKKIFRLFLLIITCCCLTEFSSGFTVKAIEIENISGVEISITSDKEEYSSGEDIKIEFSINNKTENNLSDVDWKLKLPDGIKLKNGNTSGSEIQINAGEVYNGSVFLEEFTTSSQTTTTITSTTSVKPQEINNVDSAKTGDTFNVFIPFAIIVVSLIIAFITRKKGKIVSGLFSFMVLFVVALVPINAHSVGKEHKASKVERSFKITDESFTIDFEIDFDVEIKDSDSDDTNNYDRNNKYQIDPEFTDTDSDGLTDYEELNNYHSDMNKIDTDDDGIDDYTEVNYGLNPCVPEKKSDDGNIEVLYSSGSDNDEVKADIYISMHPEQLKSFKMKRISSNDAVLSQDIPGYIGAGSAYDLSLDGTFADAVLTYTISDKLMNDPSFVPAIYYYNEEKQFLEKQANAVLVGNKISLKLEHFSWYILMNSTIQDKVWDFELYYDQSKSNRENLDIVFAIDSSGSMSTNDRNNVRKKVTKNFVDQLTEFDRAAVIDFDSYATVNCNFTNNKSTLYSAISKINSSGGTNLNIGISTALSLFENQTDSNDKLKTIVFLTDGSGYYSEDTTMKSIEMDVKIYTVGLGANNNAINEDVLKKIATMTGGEYFFADEANELYTIFDSIYELNDLEKDSDKDGISDYHEKAMAKGELRLGSGAELIDMDYLNPDSDGDNILDGEEISVVQENDLRTVYVKMTSNPSKKDSDNDGVEDKYDPYPLKHDSLEQLDNYHKAIEWGAVYFNEFATDLERIDNLRNYYNTIVVHHTTRYQYESIYSLELNEAGDGFNGIPYHFVINGKGEIYEGRPLNYKGSHVYGANSNKIGIALMGNFHPDANGIKYVLKNALPTKPTQKQYEALKALIQVLDTQYDINYYGGHRDFAIDGHDTDCPGDTLEKQLQQDGLIVLPN